MRLDDYKERISYDPNGNIQTYLRNGTGGTMRLNNYAYTYKANTNQLASISNSITNDTKNYTYDAIGNVTKDEKQHVAFNDWNVYGKLDSLVKDDGTKVKYTYDAAGQRISKRVNDTTEVYVRDASGNLLSTYVQKGKDKEVVQTELNVYGSGLLGVRDPTVEKKDTILLPNGAIAINTKFVRGAIVYQLSNYKGDVIATISDSRSPIDSNNDGKIDYYMPNLGSATYYSTYGTSAKSFNWDVVKNGFNGQIRSSEISASAQTALFWEVDLDVPFRWNIDPKTDAGVSPYSIFGGNPILNSDVFGDKPTDNYIIKANGKISRTKTLDKTDNFKFENKSGQKIDLGTFDKNAIGLINIKTSGISYDIKNTKTEKRFLKPEAFAAFLGASMNYYEEFGLKIQVNQFSNSEGGHSKHDGTGHYIDYRYSNTNGNVNKPVYTVGTNNFDEDKSQFMVNQLVNFGYNSTPSNLRGTRYSILTQLGSTNLPALKNTSYHEDHYHHVHLQNYDLSHIKPMVDDDNLLGNFKLEPIKRDNLRIGSGYGF